MQRVDSRHEPRISETDVRNLQAIFLLEAKKYENKKVDMEGLDKIF